MVFSVRLGCAERLNQEKAVENSVKRRPEAESPQTQQSWQAELKEKQKQKPKAQTEMKERAKMKKQEKKERNAKKHKE